MARDASEDTGDTGRRGDGAPAGPPRPGLGHALTGRAAILAVVVCAIALSLAYPVREYVAQRQEIAQLEHRQAEARRQVDELTRHKQRLGDRSYIEREARRRLRYCMPDEKCYIVLDGGDGDGTPAGGNGTGRRPPWYETLWRSVRDADRPR
ncbi:Cell division protein FtsL [Actinomadura rubteroloni]|uniref:Cell division protein FtsL n=1 Tax=Actinomadura rubteroloni TaxID=1926885 RepID=A0A2P4UR31_9ACTN|nr:septum formation initiator family protein [Actinomadura rubteroloni]POM27507.1 Cell division protein FtsL [Actinomadura rubteroloni]